MKRPRAMLFARIALSIVGAIAPLAAASAETEPDTRATHQPRICHGYVALKSGGYFGAFNNPNCPDGYAMYGVQMESRGSSASAATLGIHGICCQLPAPDILLAVHETHPSKCPDGFVATGADLPLTCPDCEKNLRCTKINLERYQLGTSRPSSYFGFGSTYYRERVRFFIRDIPAAIRYAMGRRGLTDWYTAGCIGFPFGSLFVEKQGKGCGLQQFRQLQFRGLQGDPSQGTPVPMFPECDDISDVYSPEPTCVRLRIPKAGEPR